MKTEQKPQKRESLDYRPINTFATDATYNQTFLVGEVAHNSRMQTKRGQSFALVTFKDITGTIQGMLWDYKNNLRAGDYVKLKIKTKKHEDQLEFQADSKDLVVLDSLPNNIFDYIKYANTDLLDSAAEFVSDLIVQEINDADYSQLIGYAISKLDLIFKLRTAPFGLEGQMAFRGGLLLQIAEALKFCNVASQIALERDLKINRSLLIVGCIFKYIGWTTTILFDGEKAVPRDALYIIGIENASTRFVDHLILACEADLQITMPEAKKQALQNVCMKDNEIVTAEGKIILYAHHMASLLNHSNTGNNKTNWQNNWFVGHV